MPYDAMLRGRISRHGQHYLLTTATAGRLPLFDALPAGRCVMNSLRHMDELGHSMTLACVVMPDHVHWLMRLGASLTLPTVVQYFKGLSARRLNLDGWHVGPLWQRGFHDHALRSDESSEAAARYVVENPVRARLVEHIGDYPLWYSAWDFSPDAASRAAVRPASRPAPSDGPISVVCQRGELTR